MRVLNRPKKPEQLHKPKAERFWQNRETRDTLGVGDSLRALEAKLAKVGKIAT